MQTVAGAATGCTAESSRTESGAWRTLTCWAARSHRCRQWLAPPQGVQLRAAGRRAAPGGRSPAGLLAPTDADSGWRRHRVRRHCEYPPTARPATARSLPSRRPCATPGGAVAPALSVSVRGLRVRDYHESQSQRSARRGRDRERRNNRPIDGERVATASCTVCPPPRDGRAVAVCVSITGAHTPIRLQEPPPG
jgi:hypothetical protein